MVTKMEPCEAPHTLLGFLLHKDQPGSRICRAEEDFHFFRDYAIREINVLLWVSLILITGLLLRKVARLLRLWAKGRKIPGPPCSSFYGHVKLISGGKSGETLTEFLSKSHEQYGSIVKLWLGPTQLLVSIKDLSIIKEMLVKAEDRLPLTGRVRKRRESLAIQLNGRLIERANAIPSKVVDYVMERIHSLMSKGVHDCRSVSQHMAFSILGATLLGDGFLSWSNATVYEELLMMIAKDASLWASYKVTPLWKRGFWRYQVLCKRLKCLTQDFIRQCRQNCKLFSQMDENTHSETTTVGRDTACGVFCAGFDMEDDLLLDEFNGHHDAREEPCGNIMGVMFHGCLTTAGLIGDILTRLVMHPEIQEKIYSEIVKVWKRSSKLELEDIYKMQFLLATVYESARLLPGPLLQRCSLKHDLNLQEGITVPAGAIMVVPVQLVQMDGSHWGSDANQFNPYRFLSKAEQGSDSVPLSPLSPFAGVGEKLNAADVPFVLNDPNANAAFLPFGSGTRACVGQKIAILGITTLFASLLKQYEIKLHPGSENDPKPTMKNCVLQPLPSPKIIFVRRND
ncbi:protein LUTEIN DEFICIENT 5, chloroplastic-like isoform X2 [Telopea speciosissima]|uniref:protein LUTEIN DEFICIENT 5, chloroplastic-like isoform X2 n=1 Tax=Telopea speciosissima TaxID=54955 RepID=UPI001CC3734D|nr:protein LUTEIN DEFICIENT 5, chloroplastic-like isoform X2 [Telopea speciosissima]